VGWSVRQEGVWSRKRGSMGCVGLSGRQEDVWSRKGGSMGCVLGEMDISKVCGIGKVVRTLEGFWAVRRWCGVFRKRGVGLSGCQ
jgi:hypothetical protein